MKLLTFAPYTVQTNSSSWSKKSPCRSWLVYKVLKQVKNIGNFSKVFQRFFFVSLEKKMKYSHFHWMYVIRLMSNNTLLSTLLYPTKQSFSFLQKHCRLYSNAMLDFIKNRNCQNENASIPRSWSNNNMMRVP